MNFSFVIMSALMLITAIGVVAFRNPIHSALCLVGNLALVAALYASLQAHFLAAVQIIVYAGAIMVLVVFVIMLLNVKEEKTAASGWFLFGLTLMLGGAFVYGLARVVTAEFGSAPLVMPDEVGTVANIGKLLYSKYVFPFEAASVLIMAAIVGATMLAKRSYGSSDKHLVRD